MGFTVEAATGRTLAIKAGKNNRTPVFVELEKLAAAKGKDRIKVLKEEAGSRPSCPRASPRRSRLRRPSKICRGARQDCRRARSPKKRVSAGKGTPILQPTGRAAPHG
jgi:hypothetical protein